MTKMMRRCGNFYKNHSRDNHLKTIVKNEVSFWLKNEMPAKNQLMNDYEQVTMA